MPNQNFNLKPSKWYILFILAIALVCIPQILTIAVLPMALRLFIIVFLVLYTLWIFWRYGFLYSKYSVRTLTKMEDATWTLHCRDHIFPGAKLQERSTVTSWIMGLIFKIPGHTIRCVILPDSLGKEEFRRLASIVRNEKHPV